MEKKESNAINIAKFILIIGVVFIHLPLRFSRSTIIGETPVYDFISSRFFLMDVSLPALFLLSGYLFFYKFNAGQDYGMSDYYKKLKTRIDSIVIPYLFWNVFWLIYNYVKNAYLSSDGAYSAIVIDSVGTFVSAFWAVGQGELPNAPIAPYTWFLRDVFVFAVLSPFYCFLYKKRSFSYLMVAVSIILLGFPDFHIPLLTPAIFIGGFFAYNKLDIQKMCDRFNWIILIVCFCIFNWLYYIVTPFPLFRIGVLGLGFILVFKASLFLYRFEWLNNLSKVATYLYLTHIFVLNVGRHSLFALIAPHTDLSLVVCYLLNFAICLLVCICSFYFLKSIKANTVLRIMTGGRF